MCYSLFTNGSENWTLLAEKWFKQKQPLKTRQKINTPLCVVCASKLYGTTRLTKER